MTTKASSCAWAPDQQHFVTLRATGSYRYAVNGEASRNQAIMLFDRLDLANPRQLLLADHGAIHHPVWSPDGHYLLYGLTNQNVTDIWWLDVASGATGPLTTDGVSSEVAWRPVNAPEPTGPAKLFLPLVRR